MANPNYESRIEKAREKIKEKPEKALQEIGKFLVKEIKLKTPKSEGSRTYNYKGKKILVKPGRLKKSMGYWYRKTEGDLQVGSKAFYAPFIEKGSSEHAATPFIMPVVMENLQVIQDMIKLALKELDDD